MKKIFNILLKNGHDCSDYLKKIDEGTIVWKNYQLKLSEYKCEKCDKKELHIDPLDTDNMIDELIEDGKRLKNN